MKREWAVSLPRVQTRRMGDVSRRFGDSTPGLLPLQDSAGHFIPAVLRIARILLLCLATCLSGCFAHLRTSEEAVLTGQVLSANGTPLSGLEVVVVDSHEALKQVLMTNERGQFTLTYLLDKAQQHHPLERSQRIKLSVWTPGYEAREYEVRFPGGRLHLDPFILQAELDETLTHSEEDVDAPSAPEQMKPGRTGRGD